MKLNLGCGTDIKKGYINVDIMKGNGIDKIVNFNKLPYPFKDNQFNEIYMNYVLEHLRLYPEDVLKELYRITKKGGKITIRVPHYTCPASYMSQHKHYFGCCSMVGFKAGSEENRWFDFSFKKVGFRLRFCRGLLSFITVPLEIFANRYPYLYENTPLKIIHAEDIIFWLKK